MSLIFHYKTDILKNLTFDMHQGINTVTENVEYLETGVPILQSKHITKGFLNIEDTKYLSDVDYLKYKDKYQAKVNDVLVCNIGTIGTSIRISKEEKFLIAWNLFLIKLDEHKLDSQYFAHYLNYLKDKNYFDKYLTGGTVKFINKKSMENIPVPLPPLSTQKRIAEILDAADALRRKDQELLKKYDELAQAIFIDMFGDPVKNEKGWEVTTLRDVCTKITDGEHGTVERLEKGKPYLMARNIRDGFIDFKEIDYISEVDHKKIFKRCNPELGDLLLVCVGATIGRVCLMSTNEEYSLARSVALIKPNKELINPAFLYSYFKSDFMQLQIKAANNSSAQAGLYTGKINDLKIYLPNIEIQRTYEKRINFILDMVKKINVDFSENLFNSLIQKAFKGELVQ